MTDLERFMKIFDPEKSKSYPGKVEIRASNMDEDMHKARQVIKDNNLRLITYTDGMLTSYRAFEVQEL